MGKIKPFRNLNSHRRIKPPVKLSNGKADIFVAAARLPPASLATIVAAARLFAIDVLMRPSSMDGSNTHYRPCS